MTTPSCFGKLEVVFPMHEDDGLRHTPESCMACLYKTECLRSAMRHPEGIQLEREQLDRAYSSGMISFLERWSKKKSLQRRLKKAAHLNENKNTGDRR